MRVPSERAANLPVAARIFSRLPPSQRLSPEELRALDRASDRFERVGNGTAPQALMDLSNYYFHKVIRPDGAATLVEYAGSLAIPTVLPPGGAELPPLILPGKSINMLVIGDGGHGNDAQRRTAAALGLMGRARGMNFVMHTGDVVYPHGISGADDPQLRDKVTSVYGDWPSMHGVPGNHDYGSVKGAGVPEAMSEASNNGMPGMFMIPQRYYSRTVVVDGMKIRTLYVDTSTIAVDPVQVAWLRRELAKDFDGMIVCGHHPIDNIGWHGSTAIMREIVRPLLDARADLYVCGHEHNQQQLRTEAGLPSIVSGAASESRPTIKWGNSEFATMRRGGAFLTISRDGIAYEALSSEKQSVLFTNHFEFRKKQPLPPERDLKQHPLPEPWP